MGSEGRRGLTGLGDSGRWTRHECSDFCEVGETDLPLGVGGCGDLLNLKKVKNLKTKIKKNVEEDNTNVGMGTLIVTLLSSGLCGDEKESTGSSTSESEGFFFQSGNE